MKTPIFALVALAIMFGALTAVSLPPVVTGLLEPGLNINVQVLNVSQGNAYVVSINGQERLLASDWDNKIVSDPTTISNLLQEDIQRSSGFADAQAALTASIADLQARRAYPESQCALYTGTDHLPCVDRESCVVAAHANPQADVMVQADGFWPAMRDEVLERANLTLSVQTLLSANASATPTAGSARALASDMGDVAAKVRALYTNNLFLSQADPQCIGGGAAQCFEYCPKINWTADASGWNGLEARLSQMAANLDSLGAQDTRAAALSLASADWMNYSKNKGPRWTAMKNALQAKTGAIDGSLSSPAAKSWNDTALQSDYQSWKAQVDQAAALANSGQFYAALSQQSQLLSTADKLSARADANSQAVAGIQSNLQAIDKSLAVLQSAHANATDLAGLTQSDAQLKASVHYPIPAGDLPSLADKSSKLEQLVLAEVGQITLGVPPVSSGNVSGQASDIVGPNNSGANTTTIPISAPLKSLGCPVAIGLAGLAGLMALLSLARPSGKEE